MIKKYIENKKNGGITMTQEDKELLLKDLCARLPYGIKCKDQYGDYININIYNAYIEHLVDQISSGIIKMILRPMSSMTKDEVKEFQSISNFKCYPKHIRGAFFDNDYTPFSTFDSSSKFCRITMSNVISCIDWLLKKHFDFRGLLEKGLALEASEGMYDLKK